MGNEHLAFSSRRKGRCVHMPRTCEGVYGMAHFDSLDDVNLHYPRVVNFHCKAEKTDLSYWTLREAYLSSALRAFRCGILLT